MHNYKKTTMKKTIAILTLTFLLTAFTPVDESFIGKITYKYSFTDLKGNDISDQMFTYFGKEQQYYIDDKNYKSYDEENNWTQLYNSETNIYYSFNKDKTAKEIDGSKTTSQIFKVTKLDITENISGYECKAFQVETDNATTIYYYTPKLKINISPFLKHNFGEWNKYLKEVDGALNLKFVVTNHKNGFIWTAIATEVTQQKLKTTDFEFPKGFELKK